MPWPQTDPVQQRQLFVQEARRGTVPFATLCTLFDVSRKTGYKWLGRADTDGMAGLVDRSRRPHSNSMAVTPDVVDRLVELRREHPYWGGRKLVAWLEAHEPWWLLPAASTVTEILKRHGLVRQRRRRERLVPARSPLASATAPNVVWSVDFKGDFRLGDGTRCYPLTVTDAYSRMALCCRAFPRPRLGPVQDALERTFREWGLPERLRSDNGPPFGTMRMGPLSRLSCWLVKVGVRPEYIDPGKPQQNGRHERFHLTLGQETAYPPGRSLLAQQRRFEAFRREYNDDRPHEALGQIPPTLVHRRSHREFPAKVRDPEYPGHYEPRRVSNRGYVRWRGESVFLAEAMSNELVGFVETDLGCWEIYFGPLLIGRMHVGLPELGLVKPLHVSPMSPV